MRVAAVAAAGAAVGGGWGATMLPDLPRDPPREVQVYDLAPLQGAHRGPPAYLPVPPGVTHVRVLTPRGPRVREFPPQATGYYWGGGAVLRQWSGGEGPAP